MTTNYCKLIMLAGLTILGAGCVTTPKANPFTVSKEDILSRVKTVAVAPLRMDDEIPNATQAKQDYDALIVSELNSVGFQTVPSTDYEQTFNRLRDEVGGFFDPNTGKADKEKFKKVQELCRRELATKFHADAVLYPTMEVYSISFARDWAVWCGTKESASDASWLEQAFVGTHSGTIPALTLCIGLYDIDGNKMYSRCAGVQLLDKVRGFGFRKVPDERILTDAQRNANAVTFAFGPLHEGEQAAKTRN